MIDGVTSLQIHEREGKMGLAAKKEEGYTYNDYITWPDEERWEIIDVEAYDMSPAPRVKHQTIVTQLARKLGDKAEEKGCRLFVAPTDVVFDEYNIVQPDVFVVCDKKKDYRSQHHRARPI